MIRSFLFNVFFYMGSIIYGIGLLPLCIIPGAHKWIAYSWTGWIMWLLKLMIGTDYEVRGQQYISPAKPVIYASKHQSAWETFALYYILKCPVFIVKREIGWLPFLGLYIFTTGMVPLNRTGGIKSFKKMIQDTKKRFLQNRSLVIFPEGTRTAPGERGLYKPGVYSLYHALGCAVVPVAMNSGIFWPRRSFLKRRGTIVIEFLSPIKAGLGKEEFMKALENTIETASLNLLPKPKLVLLDRDGVINVNSPTSVRHVGEFEFLPGAVEAIHLLNKAGIKVAVATNQANVGRGKLSEATLHDIHAHMRAELEKKGAHIDHIFYCPDAPETNSHRRKPNPGMLEEALAMFQAMPSETSMIGDDIRDLQAASKAGCIRHLVLTGHGEKTIKDPVFASVQPVHVHKDVLAAVKFILGE
jgi:1-acyl-sn-glycerol-3-phosphate acyltransferase